MSKPTLPQNKLLFGLTTKVLQRIKPYLEGFDLNYGHVLYDQGDVFGHVYFVESGIISLLAAAGERSTIEVAMVGSEGMAALPVFLGIKVSKNRAVVQGVGFAQRMKVADFLKECSFSDELPRLLRLFTYSILMQIARSAVCNRFHPIESRMARWLLMTQDRMKSTEFKITQEFLSYMLGVRREAVNKAATGFQRRKLISYVRGQMSILNRPELERMTCDCYNLTSNIEIK